MIRLSSALLLCGLVSTAAAELKEDPCACSAAKPGFFRRDKLSGDWGDERTDLEDKGVTIQGTYSLDAFATTGLAHDARVGGLFVTSLDLELDKLVTDALGQLHFSALAIHGNGLTAEVGDIYGISGNTAPQDVRLFELWYEQPVKALKIRFGMLSADQEYVLAAHSTALLNATFGIISQLSYNVLGPVYPVGTPGVSVKLAPDDGARLAVRAAIYDGDKPNFDGSAEMARTSYHGIPLDLGREQSYLAIGEVEAGKLVKLGTWHHSGNDSNGYYAIVDHQLEGSRVGAFVRASYSPKQAVAGYLDTGIRIGPGPLRPKDFMGAGIAFARTEATDASPMTGGAEFVYELTYQAQFGWLTIQPDFQLLQLRDKTYPIIATRVTVVL